MIIRRVAAGEANQRRLSAGEALLGREEGGASPGMFLFGAFSTIFLFQNKSSATTSQSSGLLAHCASRWRVPIETTIQ